MPKKAQWAERGRSGKTVAVYLPPVTIGFLRRAAKADETTVSEIVRRALRRYFLLPDDTTESSAIRDSA